VTESKRVIKIEPVGGTWEDLAKLAAELEGVRVTVRCARCPRVVMRRTLGGGEISGHFACIEHGEIAGDITVGHLYAEWTRRGKPESFNIKRNPTRLKPS
jgi:hypothetical protein